MVRRAFLLAALLCLSTPLAAQMHDHMQMQDDMNAGKADNPADEAFAGAMRKMMVDAHKSPPTGDADKDFVQMMLPHHQAAVDMAKAELMYGKDPELKTLANDIVDAQDKEIDMMKAWQAKHGGH